MKMLRGAFVILAVAVLGAGTLLYAFGANVVDQSLNRVLVPGPYQASDEARAFYEAHPKVDLHADPLLWDRDLTQRLGHGQVDFPRLHEANMTLTVMGIVSKTPVGQNFDANPSDSDQLIPLTILNGWPRPTWSSIKARALHQGANLQAYADNSGGEIVFVKSKADLRELLRRRTAGEKVTGTLLALEGMQPIENDLANLDDLFAAGVRMGGLSHFFDNEVAGSAHGVDKYGLTELGRATVARMEELGIVIDIAHASPKAVDDILATATRPFVVSHTGVKATCPGNRNLSDDHLRGIAAHGSVIGISFFAGAVCDASPKGIAKAVAHAVAVAGEDHVSLGSDFDGAVATPFDVTGMPMLVDAMRAEGLSDPVIAKVLGANALRVFMAVLPE